MIGKFGGINKKGEFVEDKELTDLMARTAAYTEGYAHGRIDGMYFAIGFCMGLAAVIIAYKKAKHGGA